MGTSGCASAGWRLITAVKAIRGPLEERGRSIKQEGLHEVVAENHGLAFFLQLWGDLLWTACIAPSGPSSLADMARALPLVRQRHEDLHDKLLADLNDAQLALVAAAVAAEFSATEQVLRERVTLAIESALRDQSRESDREAALAAERVLRHRGFVWPVVKQGIGHCEPGILGLMRHVRLNERKSRELRDLRSRRRRVA